MVDFEEAREELERRKAELAEIKVPPITKRMMHRGLLTRPKRQEITRFGKEILGQKQSYEKQIGDIDRYLAGLQNGNGIKMTEEPIVLEPKISFFAFPKLKQVRRIRRWL